MRTLARRLGVEAMSLYHHVPSKSALLDLVGDQLVATLPWPPTRGDWRAVLRGVATAWRALATEHPRAIQLLANRSLVSGQLLGRAGALLATLRAAGFSPSARVRVVQSFVAALNGWLLAENRAAWHAEVEEPSVEALLAVVPPEYAAEYAALPTEAFFLDEAAFRQFVDALIEGIGRRYATRRRRS